MKENQIIFFNDSHTYWKNGQKLRSVSYFIDKLSKEFESDYWLTHKALQAIYGEEYQNHYNSFKYRGKEGRLFQVISPDQDLLFNPFIERGDLNQINIVKEEIATKWLFKKILTQWRGSKLHKEIELSSIEKGSEQNPFTGKDVELVHSTKEWDNQSLAENLYDLKDGYYPELLVFDPVHLICGQADAVFIETVGDQRFVDINDHKTNEKQPEKSNMNRMNAPLDHLSDSKHNRYMIQVCLYAGLLSKHGFIPRNVGYTWYKDYEIDSKKLISFPYASTEIEAVFCHFFP